MEAERRLLRRRKPLSDLTNTDSHPRPSSLSSSSTASVVKPPKPHPSSRFNNPGISNRKSGTGTRSSNSSTTSNPSHPSPPVVSTPSRPLDSSSLAGTVDRDDSDPISVSFKRRHTSDKRNCNDPSTPSFLPPSIVSTPSQPRNTSSDSVAGGCDRDRDFSEHIPIVYSRGPVSDKRKGKEKAVAVPFSSTPMPKISCIREKIEVEDVNLPKAKALTVPCRRKRRAMSSKQDVSQHAMPVDFIEKQQAYFKEIDNFELPVEEVESVYDLD